MPTFQLIGLQTLEILTLIFGILGVTASLLLIFSPNLTRSISNLFNRHVNIDEKIEYVDKEINIDSFFYSHNILVGTLLAAGSVFSLIFLFFKLDISDFANIFFVSHKHQSTYEMIFYFISWVGKVACFFGLLFGFILFFSPDKMRWIENKLNFWFETRPVFDKLNNSFYGFDALLLGRSMFFGLIGLILSIFIIVLSTLNLLD